MLTLVACPACIFPDVGLFQEGVGVEWLTLHARIPPVLGDLGMRLRASHSV